MLVIVCCQFEARIPGGGVETAKCVWYNDFTTLPWMSGEASWYD
jgi:hypothetical protein